MGGQVEHEVGTKVFESKYLDFVSKQRVLTEGFEVRKRNVVRDVFGNKRLVDSRDKILQEGQGIESFLGDSQ